MPRPILATIHPEAVRHNLERVRQAVPDAKLWSVVKANAYGHGIENLFEGLRATDGRTSAWRARRTVVSSAYVTVRPASASDASRSSASPTPSSWATSSWSCWTRRFVERPVTTPSASRTSSRCARARSTSPTPRA